jgi:uncharacterized membrane protein
MSLKAFHIFFVSVSILLMIVSGTWAIKNYWNDSGIPYLVLSISFYVTAAVMTIYGFWFLRKIRREHL